MIAVLFTYETTTGILPIDPELMLGSTVTISVPFIVVVYSWGNMQKQIIRHAQRCQKVDFHDFISILVPLKRAGRPKGITTKLKIS